MSRENTDDEGLRRVLRVLGVGPDALLGHGGEAWVYALDDERVVRVLHADHDAGGVSARQRLVDELARGRPPFALPEVLEIGEVDGRWYQIDRRLRGVSVLAALATASGTGRDRLIESHLVTAAALGDLTLDARPWFGGLLEPDELHHDSWRDDLVARAARSLEVSGLAADPEALVDDLPATDLSLDAARFVHLDAFAGNMLCEGDTVTAVIDIGLTALHGDRRFDPVACAVYLTSNEITPPATARDADVARSWLRTAGLSDWEQPLRRWLAAFWSFATDDTNLMTWCRSVLTPV